MLICVVVITNISWQRKCGHFMWVDEPLTRAEKVSVKKVEADNRKLTATLLTITAQLRNVNAYDGNYLQQMERDIQNDVTRFLLMLFMVVVYAVTMASTIPWCRISVWVGDGVFFWAFTMSVTFQLWPILSGSICFLSCGNRLHIHVVLPLCCSFGSELHVYVQCSAPHVHSMGMLL